MMKNKIIISVILFGLMFAIISWLKSGKEIHVDRKTGSEITHAEKQKIRQFWQIYRAATRLRLDGDKSGAVEKYRAALRLDGEHEDALYYFANLQADLGNLEETETALNKLVEINPVSTRGYLQLAYLYLNFNRSDFFDIQKAERAADRALSLNREESGPLLCTAEIVLLKGKLEHARQILEKVTNSNFKSTQAYFLKAYIAWKNGDMASAIKQIQLTAKYNSPQLAFQGVTGEGDTKSGKVYARESTEKLYGLFAFDKSKLPDPAEPRIPAAFIDRFQTLDKHLTEIRSRYHL